ncbi:DNA polymerase III subunit delta [Candidatus Bipolaricaulota bacterium]
MTQQSIQLFSGDPYRCDQALKEREAALIAADRGIERHRHFGDEVDPASLAMELQSASLFSLGRHFVIRRVDRVRRPKPFSALLEETLPEGTFVTLLAEDLKATSPIAQAAKAANALVSLPAPRGGAIHGAARAVLEERGIRLPESALRLLVLRSGGSLLAIAGEADKLRSLGEDGALGEDAVRRLVFANAEQTVYPLYDRVGEGDLRGALCELETLRDNPGRVLGGAIRHLSRLVMVRLLLDRRTPRSDIGSWVGQPEWLLNRLTQQAKKRSLKELAHLLRTAVRLDREIKRGLVPAADALLTLVLAATPRARRAPG